MTDTPEQFAKETLPANLEQEMRQSYLDYAMSVIVGRAFIIHMVTRLFMTR